MPPCDLATLLERSAAGDRAAFAEFYDLTIDDAYRLAQVSKADLGRLDNVVLDAYLWAWLDGNLYPSTGLSPRAWILSLVKATADYYAPPRPKHSARLSHDPAEQPHSTAPALNTTRTAGAVDAAARPAATAL
jgi:DNA-directed RNA polymerase specialized sigma24 family protein